MDPAAQIKKLKKDVQMLKEELSFGNTLAQLAEIDSQVQRYLEGSLKEISIISVSQVRALFAKFKLAVQGQEQKVNARLRQTYNLGAEDQRADTPAVKVSHKNTQRPSSTRAKTKKSKDKQSQSKRQGEESPVSKKRSDSASKPKLNSVQSPEREQELQEPDTESQEPQESQPNGKEPFHPDSTLTKAEAFDDFKMGRGSKLNRILQENKAVLLERHSLHRQLIDEVNAVKREIDCTAATMQQYRETRGGQGRYSEPDDTLLNQLRELKALYRQRYEVLHDIKAEINYCQHLVDQCRVRLLSEFEKWYKKYSLVPEEDLETSMDNTLDQCDDNQLPPESSSSESFHNARYRMLRREHPVTVRHSRAEELVFRVRTENTSSNPPLSRYVGTAVSRLRRPCLSLRLLLYRAISSRAEVAGSGGAPQPQGSQRELHQKTRTTLVIVSIERLQFSFSIQLSLPSGSCRGEERRRQLERRSLWSVRMRSKVEGALKPAQEAPHSHQQLETSKSL
ncbi:hypothetical protein F7725_028871 [Dissostichus mawsoni]|uniref:Kinesin-like protein KIF6/9 C-terminal domain-containing protein n=1 Tax=Dissostichus mawsoni TaxID=36200 RepID=A0A7J5XHL1_DISMA|nr:hypothetical protein F7725_028871 [Dissostichus mawsoni]